MDFKFLKINLNIIPKTLIFSSKNFILIKLIYNKLTNENIVNHFNIKFLSKKNF